MKKTSETYRMDGRPCSIGLVTYTAMIDQKVQFRNKRKKKKGLWDYSTSCNDSCEKEPKRTKENEKGSRCSNGCNDIRERSQTNERRRKGYEFTRMVVMTTVRGATRTNKDKHLWEKSLTKDKHLWERSFKKDNHLKHEQEGATKRWRHNSFDKN